MEGEDEDFEGDDDDDGGDDEEEEEGKRTRFPGERSTLNYTCYAYTLISKFVFAPKMTGGKMQKSKNNLWMAWTMTWIILMLTTITPPRQIRRRRHPRRTTRSRQPMER